MVGGAGACGQLDPPSGHSGGRAQPAGFSGLLGPLLLRGPPPTPASRGSWGGTSHLAFFTGGG